MYVSWFDMRFFLHVENIIGSFVYVYVCAFSMFLPFFPLGASLLICFHIYIYKYISVLLYMYP